MEHDITTKEVEDLADFGALLKAHKKTLLKKRVLLSLVPISILLGSLLYFYYPANSNLPTSILDEPTDFKEVNKIVDDTTLTRGNEDTVVVELKSVEKPPKKKAEKKKHIIKETIKAPTQTVAFVKATPSYGLDSLVNYLNVELNNKALPQTNGNLVVAFTIDTSGYPRAVKIMKGLSSQVDNEIIELIKNMPAWKPAQMDGKAVASTTTLPITISIDSTIK